MKRSRKYFVLLLLAFLAVGSYLVSGTYARYTSTAEGTGTATAAKWSFTVGGKEIAKATPQTITFDLFGTLKEEDTTTAESDVAEGKVAPGTGGKVEIAVKNTSEVTADCKVTIKTDGTSTLPIEYSVDGTTWTSGSTETTTTLEKIPFTGAAAEDTVTLYWRWAFKADGTRDEADTNIGIAAQTTAPTATAKVTVVATQVD